MRSLIVLHGPLDCNSGIQVFHLANSLVQLGVDVAVASPSSTAEVRNVGDPRFECLTYADARRAVKAWARERLAIHAWTPREGVRRLVDELVRASGAPYLVHLEDNEEHLAAVYRRLPFGAFRARDLRIEPARSARFVAGAAAMTFVVDTLDAFNVAARPYALVPPVVDTVQFAPGDEGPARRREAGIQPHEFVLVYHGNLHAANRDDLQTLYLAVTRLRERGRPVRLVRLGRDDRRAASALRSLRSGVIELGVRPRAEVAGYLQMADAFVQPGKSDDFNAFRFPSKIPEFLAMGRPVILPDCNVGRELSDGSDALLLRTGTVDEIVAHVERLLDDSELRDRLGRNARAFAETRLDRNASDGPAAVVELLRRVLASRTPAPAVAGRI